MRNEYVIWEGHHACIIVLSFLGCEQNIHPVYKLEDECKLGICFVAVNFELVVYYIYGLKNMMNK